MLARLRLAAVGLAVVAALGTLAHSAQARTDDRSKAILFVHGLDAFGTSGIDCSGTWGNMINTLRAWGWTGTMATVGYYDGDTNCNYSINHHGSHSVHYGGAGEHNTSTSPWSHINDTQIEHLGYHFAWMVYDHWSQYGTYVDVVGHSMGGLVARYAVAQVQRGNPDFPPALRVEDIVTLGTPHGGTGWAYGCGWADQCNEMTPGSSFINWLASNASNPQGTAGTDWTTIGSYDDGLVSQDSAVQMSSTHKVKYLGSMNIGHSDYYNDTSDVRDADVEWWDSPGPWYSWYDAPHVVRWSDYALVYGSW